jgi:cytochrome c
VPPRADGKGGLRRCARATKETTLLGVEVLWGMDDRNNTAAGWVLAALIVALGASIVTGEVYHQERPEKMGYIVKGVEAAPGEDAAPAEKPFPFYMAQADTGKGEQIFKKCQACHVATKGGPNGLGPDLWGVIGEPIGQGANGFAFSDALKGKGGNWDFAKLNEWLTSPKAFASGTKMTFAGLSDPQDRANVIGYLNTQTDHPQPLPKAPVAEAAKPAAGEAGAKATAEAASKDAPTAKN